MIINYKNITQINHKLNNSISKRNKITDIKNNLNKN